LLVIYGDCWLESRGAFFPATGADDDRLRDASARLTSLLRQAGVDVERRPDEAAAGRQGVPVALPVREGSPDGSYGTEDEGPPPCPAVFPAEVRLAGRR
jgi:hypothetical protein